MATDVQNVKSQGNQCVIPKAIAAYSTTVPKGRHNRKPWVDLELGQITRPNLGQALISPRTILSYSL